MVGRSVRAGCWAARFAASALLVLVLGGASAALPAFAQPASAASGSVGVQSVLGLDGLVTTASETASTAPAVQSMRPRWEYIAVQVRDVRLRPSSLNSPVVGQVYWRDRVWVEGYAWGSRPYIGQTTMWLQIRYDHSNRFIWAGGVTKAKPAIVTGATQTVPPGGGMGSGWAALRECESGDNYAENTGNGFYGAYQFDIGTWESVGGTGLPSDAPPAVQDRLALKLYDERGSEPWPVCGRFLH